MLANVLPLGIGADNEILASSGSSKPTALAPLAPKQVLADTVEMGKFFGQNAEDGAKISVKTGKFLGQNGDAVIGPIDFI